MQRRRVDRRIDRRGVMLLEALVALSLVGTAALATVALTAADSAHVARVLSRSAETHAASAFFEAVALWTRQEYDRRLGTRPQGPYLLRILRPMPTVYTLELLDGTSDRILLSTAVYRPELTDAQRQ